MKQVLLLLFVLAASISCKPELRLPPQLSGLREDHPRLLFTKENEKEIKMLIKDDTLLHKIFVKSISIADSLLKKPLLEYIPDNRNVILSFSREELLRILSFSMAFRLTNDQKYRKAALREMRNICSFTSWNPSHFLDVAEMTTALAIGYDWLFNEISDGDKKVFREAILTKGIKPYFTAYDSIKPFWITTDNNWNSVCNMGIVMSALAIAEDYPQEAARVIDLMRATISTTLDKYIPDGVWYEGPGYWEYGTTYAVLGMASLNSALGTDFGLSNHKGFNKTASFYINCLSPTNHVFNFADAGTSDIRLSPSLFWLANRFRDSLIIQQYNKILNTKLTADLVQQEGNFSGRFFPLHLIWYTKLRTMISDTRPLAAFYDGDVQMMLMRSSWTDTNALFIAIKAGDNSEEHQHLDIGTFIIEQNGQRWADDLGSDHYHLPGFWEGTQGGRRWFYLRNNNRGHNTLVVGDSIQRADARCTFFEVNDTSANPYASINLTEAYRNQLKFCTRTVAMHENKIIVIHDKIKSHLKPETIRWAFVTKASFSNNDIITRLKLNGKSFFVRVVKPKNIMLREFSLKPTSLDERSTESYKMIGFNLKSNKDVELEVIFSADSIALKNY